MTNTSPIKKKKALFLYYEIAGYFVACLQRLTSLYNIEAHVIRLPINAEAPFKFAQDDNIKYYERVNYNKEQLLDLVISIDPDFIFCSGWMDKSYLNICKKFRSKIPTVLAFDNPWIGSIKQHIASVTQPFIFSNIFSHCWVPGKPQVKFAHRLGFKKENVFEGMYSADDALFENFYEMYKDEKQQTFPKRFLYVGRYIEIKGVRDLWKAFVDLQNEMPNEWELWCVGKGDFDPIFPKHDKIKNIGFVQPKDLHTIIKDTGVFMMPSHKDHWGVAIHEFAMAGYPMICSEWAFAATTFLKEGFNGYFHKPKNPASIVDAMKKMIVTKERIQKEMCTRSHDLSKTITLNTWAGVVAEIMGLKQLQTLNFKL